MEKELSFTINEDGELVAVKEPYMTLNFATKEDWEGFKNKHDLEKTKQKEEKNLFIWGFDEELEYSLGDETCIEDCIKEARAYINTEEGTQYYEDDKGEVRLFITEITPYKPCFDGEDIVGYLVRQADNTHGEDIVNEWLLNSNGDDLAKELTKTLNKWLEKNNEIPNFGDMLGIKEYSLKSGKEVNSYEK